jgi:Fe-S cluster assembly ATPase SufC
MIKKIRVKNFKSFKDLELSLGKVNILIGANASGKSNFVQIFRFLRDIARFDLDNAISQGGVEYLRNVNIDFSECLSIEISHIHNQEGDFVIGTPQRVLKINETRYTLVMEFGNDKPEFRIVEEKLIWKGNLFESNEQEETINNKKVVGSGEIIISNVKGNLDEKISISDQSGKVETSQVTLPKGLKLPGKSIIFGYPSYLEFSGQPTSSNIFDLDPKLSKMGVPIFAKADLEEDGSNLVIVIKKILDDPEKKRMFMNLVSYLLPYVEDIKVDKFTETHYFLKIKETYSDKHYLPAPLISDGTINALGLIVALYFQESPLIIIEEPDRGFHPSLISSVVEMMKDATKYSDKQIIVTTHNPEMVRYADLKNIFLVSRNENGFSSIVKPFRKKDVKIFLENGLRPEELYVDNLLEM